MRLSGATKEEKASSRRWLEDAIDKGRNGDIVPRQQPAMASQDGALWWRYLSVFILPVIAATEISRFVFTAGDKHNDFGVAAGVADLSIIKPRLR